MKIECSHKEWSIINNILIKEYETNIAYFGDTFRGHVGYEGQFCFHVDGKFIEEKCE